MAAFNERPTKVTPAPPTQVEIKEVVRTEYMMVPDDSTERHWQEALRRMVRVNGRDGVRFAHQLQEIKSLVHSGDVAGSI